MQAGLFVIISSEGKHIIVYTRRYTGTTSAHSEHISCISYLRLKNINVCQNDRLFDSKDFENVIYTCKFKHKLTVDSQVLIEPNIVIPIIFILIYIRL